MLRPFAAPDRFSQAANFGARNAEMPPRKSISDQQTNFTECRYPGLFVRLASSIATEGDLT
jgi:hypothetical protein